MCLVGGLRVGGKAGGLTDRRATTFTVRPGVFFGGGAGPVLVVAFAVGGLDEGLVVLFERAIWGDLGKLTSEEVERRSSKGSENVILGEPVGPVDVDAMVASWCFQCDFVFG